MIIWKKLCEKGQKGNQVQCGDEETQSWERRTKWRTKGTLYEACARGVESQRTMYIDRLLRDEWVRNSNGGDMLTCSIVTYLVTSVHPNSSIV